MSSEEIVKPILIEGLLKTAAWYIDNGAGYLQSVFDQIGFIDRKSDREKYYTLPAPLSSKVCYPVRGKVQELAAAKKETHQKIVESHKGFAPAYLETLTTSQLFFLLEKFGSNVPCDEKGDVALFDRYKMLAAKEVLRANRSNPIKKTTFLFLLIFPGSRDSSTTSFPRAL